MPVKIKEMLASATYQPRFDFGCDHESDTATIKELLIELNHQKRNVLIADYNLKSLGTTLGFASSILGVDAPRRIDQQLPVTYIKTIKLLFKRNQYVDFHLLRLIQTPGSNTPATLDFFTSPVSPETEAVKKELDRISSALEREIGTDEVAKIQEICDPRQLREVFLKETNEAVDKTLLTHVHIEDDLLGAADDYVAGKTNEFRKSLHPFEREKRLHVAVYVYLKLLDYVHRLYFDISTGLTIPNDRGVANKRIDFAVICKKISDSNRRPIVAGTNFMSTEDVPDFVSHYSSDIAQLVSQTTGFKYNKRDVSADERRALVALRLYLSGANLPHELNQKPVGVVHVVAAFCSVLHQRKLKSKPDKTSRRYGSKYSAPQKLLDEHISKGTHVPGTVQFKYRERTRWYVHALLGRKHRADSHIAVRISQSKLSWDVYMSLDHEQIRQHIAAYRDFITKAAHDFVVIHGRQETFYEWSHGG